MLDFFTRCENTALGEAIRGSLWLFPVIESFHLLALALIGGAVLAVHLRLLGLILPAHSSAELWRQMRPWFAAGWTVMILSGLLLFFSEAVKLYYSEAFWWKISLLVLATLFTLTAVRRIALRDSGDWSARATALLSLVLWSGVGAAGRWIGFS